MQLAGGLDVEIWTISSLFVVGALHNFGAPQKVATASDGVDAI